MSSPLDTGTWTRTFNDDFDTLSLNDGQNGTWKTSFYFGDRTLNGNGERQYYMDPNYSGAADHPLGVNPFNTHDGVLTIEAAPTDPSVASAIWNYPYTSGLITTEPSFSQQYGYFEMRAELPEGSGMWPAFWMLPTDKSWPPELDVLEAFGAQNGNGEGGANHIHVGQIAANGAESAGEWIDVGVNTHSDFHTYGVDWEPDTITWYFDGQAVASHATPSDMHKPMYMLANLAVGGNWPGQPDGEAAHMDIDYIRAYSHDPNAVPATGAASAEAHIPPPSDPVVDPVAAQIAAVNNEYHI